MSQATEGICRSIGACSVLEETGPIEHSNSNMEAGCDFCPESEEEEESVGDSGVAVIAFSEAGKVFTFGQPTTDVVIHRYLGKAFSDPAIGTQLATPRRHCLLFSTGSHGTDGCGGDKFTNHSFPYI